MIASDHISAWSLSFFSHTHFHTRCSVSLGSSSSLISCFSSSVVCLHILFIQSSRRLSLSLTHTSNRLHFTAHCRHYLPFLPMAVITVTEMTIWRNHSLSSQISLPSPCVSLCTQNICLCVCVYESAAISFFVFYCHRRTIFCVLFLL